MWYFLMKVLLVVSERISVCGVRGLAMTTKNTGTFALPVIIGIVALLLANPTYNTALCEDASEIKYPGKIGILNGPIRSPVEQNESKNLLCRFSSCVLPPSDIDPSGLIALRAERNYPFAGELPAPLQKQKDSASDIISLSDKKSCPLYLRNITLLF